MCRIAAWAQPQGLAGGGSPWDNLPAQESPCHPGSEDPWRRGGSLLQCSCLENPADEGSLAGYRPWGHKEMDTT